MISFKLLPEGCAFQRMSIADFLSRIVNELTNLIYLIIKSIKIIDFLSFMYYLPNIFSCIVNYCFCIIIFILLWKSKDTCKSKRQRWKMSAVNSEIILLNHCSLSYPWLRSVQKVIISFAGHDLSLNSCWESLSEELILSLFVIHFGKIVSKRSVVPSCKVYYKEWRTLRCYRSVAGLVKLETKRLSLETLASYFFDWEYLKFVTSAFYYEPFWGTVL